MKAVWFVVTLFRTFSHWFRQAMRLTLFSIALHISTLALVEGYCYWLWDAVYVPRYLNLNGITQEIIKDLRTATALTDTRWHSYRDPNYDNGSNSVERRSAVHRCKNRNSSGSYFLLRRSMWHRCICLHSFNRET